jgi:4-amino-4-deoxychorismate lyase
MRHCLINGEAIDQLPVSDRGLHYGDGLFETIAVNDGQPVYWEAHLARLGEGCSRLGMPSPSSELLAGEARSVVPQQGRSVLKILITRGSGGRGYLPPGTCEPRRIVMSFDWPDYPDSYYSEGVQLRLCTTRLACQPQLLGLKHLNRLENVLARQEWQDPDIAEGLMCDSRGQVIEGTMSNLFLVRQGTLITPDLARCGVRGIMRDRIIELAAGLGIAHARRDIEATELDTAQELFVCNSILGIWPARMAGTPTTCPGPVTRTLMQQLAASDSLPAFR